MKWNLLAVIVTAAIIGMLLWFQRADDPYQLPWSPDGPTQPTSTDSRPQNSAERVGVIQPQPEPRYTNEIKRCTAPDGSTFYTNAISCDQADLSNQLSIVDAPTRRPASQATRQASEPSTARQTSAQRSRPANRCGPGRPTQEAVSNKVPRACRWEWGRAQELDKLIRIADEPSESIWFEEYCERLREVRENGCRVDPSAFCFEELCLGR